ncbi:TlpA family protein disulfide reductase [Arcobacter roscoffensis]|uniref:TlpA family protein disulfide reductase n=1 Tax=Arcobacter roscoffensis TaxID=2961520 RepID=A0ABY5E287_9BACT|nr:TlpA disulfide reductase family protein [Arcobacter roscoffensis]UTJ05607.1 TlpA family protein disulfide reductase [Arcobacter roscoffensis]|tara:strand:+ start:221 stop:778 length:558 start_codon:yes stop_codon:yes gene_type:complete
MQFKTLAFLSILSILFFTGCSSEDKKTTDVTQEETVIKKSNEISLTTIDNKTITIINDDNKYKIKEYPNKIVLLNFFATWCPPCKAEIPNLITLQEKYQGDFKVISVLLEKNKSNEEIVEFSNKFNINYDVTNTEDNFKLADKIGPIKSIPTMFMLDKNGDVFQKYIGIVPVEMMELDINRLLKK